MFSHHDRPATAGRDQQRGGAAVQAVHARGPRQPVQPGLVQAVVQRRRDGHGVEQRPLEGVGQDPAAVEHAQAAETAAVARVLRGRRRRAGDRGQPKGPERAAPGGGVHVAGAGRTAVREYRRPVATTSSPVACANDVDGGYTRIMERRGGRKDR